MTFLGLAATLSCKTKMMKAVDATATTIAALSLTSWNIKMTTRDSVARPRWNK